DKLQTEHRNRPLKSSQKQMRKDCTCIHEARPSISRWELQESARRWKALITLYHQNTDPCFQNNLKSRENPMCESSRENIKTLMN
ncbi:mCG145849, partial [Mus musculus]